MTSIIPATEWETIVARRNRGESVTFSARGYGCSLGTIYGILKKAAESQPSNEGAPTSGPPVRHCCDNRSSRWMLHRPQSSRSEKSRASIPQGRRPRRRYGVT
ncbi:hypothetical protein GCM10011611_50250 [Aliidongia dinghuensis]|uniref:Uncharacterized protein n=1 Tax=Aliidongia dinghuensis TaxID=1867774 RepID=A0A8J3E4D4_9PROT|nr:hypothetical protein GCM10011611_50250 [Aliidongia dinghuensis]